MDKKQKIKMALAVCFVSVCGIGYLTVHYGGQRKEQIVLEQKKDELSLVEEEVASETDTIETTDDGSVNQATLLQEKQSADIYVHICGAVTKEGVYVLPERSRLKDGVEAAGGFLETADTTYHNLAAVLADGQKVYIPTLEETEGMSVTERLTDMEEGENDTASSLKDLRGNKVNINTADAGELMTLSGIGEAKASSILQYREKVGAFQSIEELKNVSGIGDAMFERVKEFIVAE